MHDHFAGIAQDAKHEPFRVLIAGLIPDFVLRYALLGVAAAASEMIAFLDADDVFLPDKLARQIGAMEAAGAAWSYTDCYYVGSRGRFRRPNSWFHGWPGGLPSGSALRAAHLAGHNFVTMSSVVVRRDSCPAFDPALPVSEDWDAFVRLAEAQDGLAVNEPLHLYRLNPAGGRHAAGLDRYVEVNMAILRGAFGRAGLPADSPAFRRAAARIRRRALIQRLNAGRSWPWRALLRLYCGSWL